MNPRIKFVEVRTILLCMFLCWYIIFTTYVIQSTLKTDVKLREFIENPTLKRQLKVEGLKQVASKFPLSSQSSNLLGKYMSKLPQGFPKIICSDRPAP